VASKIGQDDGTGIEIVNVRGEVLLSTDSTGARSAYSLGGPTCSACHEDGTARPSSQTAFIEGPGGATDQVFAAPLINAEGCRACHAEDGHKLGMVLVHRTLEPVHRQVRRVQIGIAVAGVVALVTTILTIRMVLGRYLDRPLRALVAGAREIGAGNLGNTIALPERTELAVLADTLNSSTERLAGLQRELVEQERLAAIGETVAGLSHCLKNILNGLRAGQYVIDRGMERNDIEKLRTGWRVMRDGVRQVETLTYDMLFCARDQVPRREPTDPNEVIQEVIDLLGESAAEKGVELRAELDEAIGAADLDRTMIYRALLNLATNAIQACTESESGDAVTLISRAAPDQVVLVVEDNGVGMSAAVRSQLFVRFYSTRASGGGTGLGLAVVKQIAEGHGGTVRVDSEPGKGSVFRLHLPRVEPDPGNIAGSPA
jgi:signal transduction histidine kinase